MRISPTNDEILPCELQIRTELQHTWAEREHKLIYKNDKLTPLSGEPEYSQVLAISSACMSILQGVDEQLEAIRSLVNGMITKSEKADSNNGVT